jgi:zinc transport system substrate-binding protein
MKKIALISALFITTYSYATINAIVSITPQKTFLSQIAKDKVNITVMVNPGVSIHTYEPKPSDMKKITKANIYFGIGVEFEEHWLDKFKALNSNMTIIDTSKGINKLTSIKNKHHHEDEHLDPHIWTSSKNVKQIATNMLNTLVLKDSENKEFYTKNYNEFIKKIENTNTTIKNILSKKDAKSFMVFHPSWQYFAKQYNLKQIPIEIEGKKPKPKTIRNLILQAKKNNIKAIFASPYKSNKIADLISNELKIKVIKISPMNEQWSDTMIKMAESI